MFSMSNADELKQRALQSQKDKEEGQEQQVADVADPQTGGKGEEGKGSPTPDEEAGPEARVSDEPKSSPPSKGEIDGDTPPAMTTEQVEEFFTSTMARLNSSQEREDIKSKVTKETRIPSLLIQIQHDQLAKMGVRKEEGQDALNRYARSFTAEDPDARRKMEEFTHTCQRTYIEVLREMEPEEAETEAKLTQAQIMEFFEACDTLLALPETKESLRKEFLDTKEPPDETIVGMQRTMLRTLGFAPDHGVACLNSFAETYPDDDRLQMRLRQFMQCASMARQEAILGKEELTKRMQLQQAAAMREHKLAMELKSLDEEGKKDLAKRVSEMQRKHAMAVMALTTQEERLAYVKGIPAEEQWEIAKLKMLTMQARGNGHGHGHSHAHGQPCSGHDHGHGHGPMAQPNPTGGHGGHSHSHRDGEHSTHDHEHSHDHAS